MRKILPCRFKQGFGVFNILTAHKCSDTGLFRLLSMSAFCSLKFQKEITSEARLFFTNNSKFYVESGKAERNWPNIFEFGDNCI